MNASAFRFLFDISGSSALLDAVIVLCARYLPWALALFAVVLGWYGASRPRERLFFFLETAAAVVLGCGIIATAVRFFFPHGRPAELMNIEPLFSAGGSSFPSGLAAAFFALAAILFFSRRSWGVWYFLAATVNAVALIMAGVHWPSDVLGGAIAGIVAALVVHVLFAPAGRRLGAYPGQETGEELSP